MKTVHLVFDDGAFSCPSWVRYGDRGAADKALVTCWACLNWWECW